MRTLLLTISFIFFSLLPSAYSQSYFPQNQKGTAYNHLTGALPRPANAGADSLYTFLDYYIADSTLYSPNYKGLQGQLLNSYYTFNGGHSDTTNSYKAKSMFYQNYFCINSVTVAFDSLVIGATGRSLDSMGAAIIDTIYVPIIQVHHSAHANFDTLELQLNNVDINGYPINNTYILDTLIIGDTIGAGNDYTIKTIKWNLSNYRLSGAKKFAVTVTYHDLTKHDSCWFVYGYGYFKSVCPFESVDTFANITHFTKIRNNTKEYFANSFCLFNQYAGFGYFPTPDGNNEFFPCVAADTDHFTPGVDGANYIQDIDIAADVLFVSYLGVPNIYSPNISVSQNYPNPFNTATSINYTVVKTSDVTLKVVDLAGREILSQLYGNVNPGQHSINLNGTNFSAGVYFYSLTSSGYTVTKKMVIY